MLPIDCYCGRDPAFRLLGQLKKPVVASVAVLLFISGLMPAIAHAEGRQAVGGHVGFVVPLVSRSAGRRPQWLTTSCSGCQRAWSEEVRPIRRRFRGGARVPE